MEHLIQTEASRLQATGEHASAEYEKEVAATLDLVLSDSSSAIDLGKFKAQRRRETEALERYLEDRRAYQELLQVLLAA